MEGRRMEKLRNFICRHVWLLVGAVIFIFLLVSLAQLRLPGQLCLLASIGCASVAQVDRYRSPGNQREANLGFLVVILALTGLIFIWPGSAKAIVLHLLGGLASIHG
jgi:hypothetical protein